MNQPLYKVRGWRPLFAGAALLLTTLACSFGARAPQPIWRYEIPDIWIDSPTYLQLEAERVYLAPKLPPVYDKTTLISQAPETHVLTALDLATGTSLWTQQVEIKFGADWLASAGHVIFISPPAPGATAQSIVALDGATGQPAWRFDAMQLDDYLLLQGPCLFIFATAGELLCVDAASGRTLGVFPGPPAGEERVDGATTLTRITEDALYRLTPAGVLRVYGVPQATHIYSRTLALPGTPITFDVEAAHAFIGATSNAATQTLAVFALPSGQLRWTAPDVGRLAQVVERAGRQYALFTRPTGSELPAGLMVFDLATGTRLFEVAAANGAYWVSPDDRFEVFDVQDGALRWRLKRGVEMLTPPGTGDVLLGDGGLLERFPLAPR